VNGKERMDAGIESPLVIVTVYYLTTCTALVYTLRAVPLNLLRAGTRIFICRPSRRKEKRKQTFPHQLSAIGSQRKTRAEKRSCPVPSFNTQRRAPAFPTKLNERPVWICVSKTVSPVNADFFLRSFTYSFKKHTALFSTGTLAQCKPPLPKTGSYSM
jgi:hypothetical protein